MNIIKKLFKTNTKLPPADEIISKFNTGATIDIEAAANYYGCTIEELTKAIEKSDDVNITTVSISKNNPNLVANLIAVKLLQAMVKSHTLKIPKKYIRDELLNDVLTSFGDLKELDFKEEAKQEVNKLIEMYDSDTITSKTFIEFVKIIKKTLSSEIINSLKHYFEYKYQREVTNENMSIFIAFRALNCQNITPRDFKILMSLI